MCVQKTIAIKACGYSFGMELLQNRIPAEDNPEYL